MPVKSTVLIALFASAGCAVELDTSSEQQAMCTPLSCFNSPEVAHNNVWEASLRGRPDASGISIASVGGVAQIVGVNGLTYDLSVTNGRLTGTRSNGDTIEGPQLIGAEITLKQNKKPLFVIHIDGVRMTAFPIGSPDPLELYVMTWHEPGGLPSPDRPLCNELLDQSVEKDPLVGLWSMHVNETLVFEGDRFDPFAMTASDAYDPNWFNFGCAGHTLAKLHLTRHTTIAGNPIWAERQAAMKLLAADYCGDGTPYTKTGVHVMWQDQRWMSYPVVPGAIEARWNENGATCLSKPRFEDPTVIFGHCPSLPLCTNLDPYAYDGSLMVSAN